MGVTVYSGRTADDESSDQSNAQFPLLVHSGTHHVRFGSVGKNANEEQRVEHSVQRQNNAGQGNRLDFWEEGSVSNSQ